MAFTIPNEATAGFGDQSEIDKVDFDILVAAYAATGVVSGCGVTAQGAPNMTVAVASGVCYFAGVRTTITGGNSTVGAADATLDRYDLICATSAGSFTTVAGTPAANPVFPDIPASRVVLAAVYVPATTTAIDSTRIVDKRIVLGLTPIVSESLLAAFSIDGDISVRTGAHRVYIPFAAQITRVSMALGTPPVGASARPDVNRNGTTIFTTQTNRPTVSAGTNFGESTTIENGTLASGDYITADIDTIGSTTAGANMVIEVWGKRL